MVNRKIIALGVLSLMLAACDTEKIYRGVPDQSWQQLTAEQKQLIVDKSFKEDTK